MTSRSEDRPNWKVRLVGGDRGRATVLCRKSTFEVGPPLSFDLDLPCTTALEHLIAAVGADLVNGFRERARKKRLQVDEVEGTVEATLNNALTYLEVVGEEGDPGLARLSVRVFISSMEEQSKLEPVWQQTVERSPVLRSLHPRVQLDLSYRVVF